jgi:hypothetical protein
MQSKLIIIIQFNCSTTPSPMLIQSQEKGQTKQIIIIIIIIIYLRREIKPVVFLNELRCFHYPASKRKATQTSYHIKI